MYRSESQQTMFCLKSFLVNKIPTLLTQLQGSIYPLTSEFCITQALTHVDPNAFPAFSQGFDMTGNSNVLSEVRQDFLNACALHELIPINSIERLLGETPVQSPPEVRYTKDGLVKQCENNFEKMTMLLDELENVDGNGGGIVGAVTEVCNLRPEEVTVSLTTFKIIQNFCRGNPDTMSLKTICNSLLRKPQALDIMLQFTSPASILQPLCQVLDEWKYDQDQGTFLFILLQICTHCHRGISTRL
jgi:mediator of RNA polymerase II transcription subunit 5